MEVSWIRQGDARYPVELLQRMGGEAPPAIAVAGDTNILRHPRMGLICTIQVPGSIIIKTFDLIRKIRDAHAAVIGGFHSPMEQECLEVLLRGVQPVVICPARSLRRLRIGQSARKALAEGRLLVLSRFGDEVRRTTSVQAMQRNDLVAALSEVILVPHASPDGKAWDAVRRALDRGQKVFSLDDEANAELLACGAKICHSGHLDDLISSTGKSRASEDGRP